MGNRGWLIFLASFLCSDVLGFFKRDILLKDFLEGFWGGALIALACFSLLPESITSRIYLCAACMTAGALLINFPRRAPEALSWVLALAGILLGGATGGVSAAVSAGILIYIGASAALPEHKPPGAERMTKLGGLLGFLSAAFNLI